MELTFKNNNLEIEENSNYKLLSNLVQYDYRTDYLIKERLLHLYLNRYYKFYFKSDGNFLYIKRNGIYHFEDKDKIEPISIFRLSNKLEKVFGFDKTFIIKIIKQWLKYCFHLTDKEIDDVENFFIFTSNYEQIPLQFTMIRYSQFILRDSNGIISLLQSS